MLEMDELGMFFPLRLDQKEGIHPSSARRIPEPSRHKEPGFRSTRELCAASYSRYQEACLGVTDSSPVSEGKGPSVTPHLSGIKTMK